MDSDPFFQHHDAIRRALDAVARANESLEECAARPAYQRDVLGEWRAGMPKPKPEHVLAAQTQADLRAFKNEVRAYRAGLEEALGKVIADQRKEIAALREEIAQLRVPIPPFCLVPPEKGLSDAIRT